MILKTLLALLVATPLHAQLYPDRTLDTLEITTEGFNVVVSYYNTHEALSLPVDETHTVNGVEFSVVVVVNAMAPETLIVKTITPGYQVIPQEVTEVEDGEEFIVFISPITG